VTRKLLLKSAVTTIGLATNWRSKDAEGNYVSEPEYHNLVCFGALAEFSAKTIKQGTPLYIEGRIHTSKYQTKDGKDASKTEVIVEKLVLLSSKKGETQAAEA
jgi:single-strand DNA-binding protein